jgi:hypothetical protein
VIAIDVEGDGPPTNRNKELLMEYLIPVWILGAPAAALIGASFFRPKQAPVRHPERSGVESTSYRP